MTGVRRQLSGLLASGFLRQSSIYFVASSSKAAIFMLTAPLLALLLEARDFGYWSLYRTMLLCAVPALGLGLMPAAQRNWFRQEPPALAAFTGLCVILLVAETVIVTAALWGLIGGGGLLSLSSFWALTLPAAALLTNLVLINQVYVRQAQRPWTFAAYDLSLVLLPLLLGVPLVLLGHDWHGMATGLLCGTALCTLAALWQMRRTGWLTISPQRMQLRATLLFALPLIPHAVGSTVVAIGDRLVIDDLLGPTQVGLYSAAYTVAMALQLVSIPFNNAWSVWSLEQLEADPQEGPRRVARGYLFYAGLVSVAALVLALLGPWVLRLLFPTEYWPASGVIAWVVAGLWCQALHQALYMVLLHHGRTRWMAASVILATAVNIAGCYLLIPRFGIEGAAMATLSAYGCMLIGTIAAVQLLHPLPWRRRRHL